MEKETEKHGVWLHLDGCRDYSQMVQIQKELHRKRERDEIPDLVMLLEHAPCITIGRSGGFDHLLAGNEVLKREGITVHETTRGGDITYHGPGQLVCYPILSLKEEKDLHLYARRMEEVMIRTAATYGIEAGRRDGFPGAWVGEKKIGALGIAVRKWVSMHGVAFNVCPDLTHFSLIVPCGLTGAGIGVTSLEKLLPQPPELSEVRQEMYRRFQEVFHCTMSLGHLEDYIQEEEL